MTVWEAIILGLVEGLTEFLPVSSTGHLIIAAKLLNLPATAFSASFMIAIQLGAILAVTCLYGERLYKERATAFKVGVAFLPTALIGVVVYPLVKNVLLGSLWVTVIALAFGGLIMIGLERWYRRSRPVGRELSLLTYREAWWLGLAQAVSMIPGVSRAGATIMAGLYLGLSRPAVVEFTFLLALPTMLSATMYDLYRSAGSFRLTEWPLLAIGFVVSFGAALVAVQWLLRFIKTHDFTAFGFYRIGLALFVWWLLLG